MARILTDTEIEDLIAEAKVLPSNWRSRLTPKAKSRYQYDERQLEVESTSGRLFRIVLRSNRQNLLDFSVILIHEDTDGSEFRLLRYNGKHPSRHTNRWEKERRLANSRFDPAFHIHKATERYQEAGYMIDGYAEPTEDYGDHGTALDAFVLRCGMKDDSPQQRFL